MSNLYHILDFIPGLAKEEMLVGEESLAHRIVESGRLRIDADEKINFARFMAPQLNISMMFSYRELYDPQLIQRTRSIISDQFKKFYSDTKLEKKINEHIAFMKNEIEKYQKVSHEEELKLARLLVQSSHPVVIMLILIEGAEMFISYSHSIGDMLDIATWKTCGTNSGMQSTDGRDVSIFVSCGGNPLKPNEEPNATYGDGWPAIARLIVVAGQEVGHYSDIMRDSKGRQVGRYSANFSATRATPHVKKGRISDIAKSKALLEELNSIGLVKLCEDEKALKFFRENKRYGAVFIYTCTKILIRMCVLSVRARGAASDIVSKFRREQYVGLMITACFEDMLFNLSPKADVYARDDKEEEEAIACVEALARVPQQANKWGHKIASICMADLYSIYYRQVIPGCIKAYENMSGKKYVFDKSRQASLLYRIRKLFSKEKLIPTRL